ncbi:MAG TPA: hypothetical protein VGJ83_05570 [Gemmatimonadales bacterium]
MRLWLLAPLVACAAVALAYLPPRGVRDRGDRGWFGPRAPTPTAARQRAQALAGEWRAAQAAVRLAESRGRLPVAPAEGPALLFVGPDSVPVAPRRRVAAALDSAWHQLGLGETKISVGVVLQFRPGADRPGAPSERGGGVAYLLPDSTDRTACVVLLPPGLGLTRWLLSERRPEDRFRLEDWLAASLGPCAFYAAYGAPGKPVRRWLAQRGFDLALAPAWRDPPQGSPYVGFFVNSMTRTWNWEWVYHQSFPAVACLGGRAGGCREAVLAGAGGDWRDSVPRVLVPSRVWWRQQRLIAGERYLADVARAVGPERFVRFWNSPLPVDTALAAALGEPVGEWTARWQGSLGPPLPPLGASAPLGSALLALLLAAGALSGVALSAARRQVR